MCHLGISTGTHSRMSRSREILESTFQDLGGRKTQFLAEKCKQFREESSALKVDNL